MDFDCRARNVLESGQRITQRKPCAVFSPKSYILSINQLVCTTQTRRLYASTTHTIRVQVPMMMFFFFYYSGGTIRKHNKEISCGLQQESGSSNRDTRKQEKNKRI
jgi:hypothetical protein